LGVDDRVGSLAPGKAATLCVWSGDPLDVRSRVEAAWIDGRPVLVDPIHRGTPLGFPGPLRLPREGAHRVGRRNHLGTVGQQHLEAGAAAGARLHPCPAAV